MKKEISGLKIFTVIIVFLLSVAVFRFNKSLRVPSIFDGKFYNTLEIKTSTNKISLPKKTVPIPDLQYWADSISYAENLYTDIFLKIQILLHF